VIEGVTEFLPVSSTGHLLVAADLLLFERSAGGTFEIFIQSGAVLALLAFYGSELLAHARALLRASLGLAPLVLAACAGGSPAAPGAVRLGTAPARPGRRRRTSPSRPSSASRSPRPT
jgi:undecaprenyl-diphosphatase